MNQSLHFRTSHASTLVALLFLVAWFSVGCGPFAAEEAETEAPLVIRTAKPTFTPTPAAMPAAAMPAAQPTPQPPAEEVTGVPSGPAPKEQPPLGAPPPVERARAVINGPLINARSGPGLNFEVVATVERGAEFDIIAKNTAGDWWQICCIAGRDAWVIDDFVDTLGPVDSVPVVGQAAPPALPQAAATAAPPAVPPTATPVPAPSETFVLERQEQFAETSLVRIFLYVYTGTNALEGYGLQVTKDGAPLPSEGRSFGGQPAFTWPFQDPRQRYQNLKLEFPNVPPAGAWQLQLVDRNGSPTGPVATFTLAANDPNQELYVRYQRQ